MVHDSPRARGKPQDMDQCDEASFDILKNVYAIHAMINV